MSTFFEGLEQASQERARSEVMARSETANEWVLALAAEREKGLEELERLLGYVQFDLGLCAAVAVIFAIALSFEPTGFKFHRGFLSLAVGFSCLAGVAAGVVASRCADFRSRGELCAAKIGPFRSRWLKGTHWLYMQRICFGMALAAAVLSILMGSGKWLLIPCCMS